MIQVIKVYWGKSFLRTFKQICKKDMDFKKTFEDFFRDFCKKPNNKKYNSHKLKGKLSGLYSVKIKYDLRLIAEIRKNEIILMDIGTQDEVY